MRRVHRTLALLSLVIALGIAGCGSGTSDDSGPRKLDGSRSQEFERDDLERADDASDAVKDYCAGAVSEAQRLGCESHVTDADLP